MSACFSDLPFDVRACCRHYTLHCSGRFRTDTVARDERNRVFRHYYLALVKIVDDLLTATLERTFGFFRIERHTLFKALFDAWSDLTL